MQNGYDTYIHAHWSSLRTVPDEPAAVQSGDLEGEGRHHRGHLDGDEDAGDGVGQGDGGVVREDNEHEVRDEVPGAVHEVDEVVRDQGEREQYGQVEDGLHSGLGQEVRRHVVGAAVALSQHERSLQGKVAGAQEAAHHSLEHHAEVHGRAQRVYGGLVGAQVPPHAQADEQGHRHGREDVDHEHVDLSDLVQRLAATENPQLLVPLASCARMQVSLCVCMCGESESESPRKSEHYSHLFSWETLSR